MQSCKTCVGSHLIHRLVYLRLHTLVWCDEKSKSNDHEVTRKFFLVLNDYMIKSVRTSSFSVSRVSCGTYSRVLRAQSALARVLSIRGFCIDLEPAFGRMQ